MTDRDEVKNEPADKSFNVSGSSGDLDAILDSNPDLRRRLCGDDDDRPKAWDFELGCGELGRGEEE